MRFDELIAPVTPDAFMRDSFGQHPLHVPAPASGRALVGWERLNELLAIRSHWTEANIKLVLNSRSIYPDLYLDEVETAGGKVRRADPAKVKVFLSMGASLVANAVDEIDPGIAAAASALADHFSARASANIYCSFQGIQAFSSHCDLHEVFALQCEGEKVWNLYRNRASAPVEALQGPDAQAIIDAAKGPVMARIRMRPGDLLYIPRGVYHDALATNAPSLHVTFSVTPLTGRILFRMLEEEALADEVFRHYLPDGRVDDGRLLSERLSSLGERIAARMRTKRFAASVATRQRSLWEPTIGFDLPNRGGVENFLRTDRPAELRREDEGVVLAASGFLHPLGAGGTVAEWILMQQGFTFDQLAAQFKQWERQELRHLVETLVHYGLIRSYTAEL